jgi:hypothetical protein
LHLVGFLSQVKEPHHPASPISSIDGPKMNENAMLDTHTASGAQHHFIASGEFGSDFEIDGDTPSGGDNGINRRKEIKTGIIGKSKTGKIGAFG